MEDYIRALAPQGSAALGHCQIIVTIDHLTIDCPSVYYITLLSELDGFTPCALEVKQVCVLRDGQHQFTFSVANFLATKAKQDQFDLDLDL